MRKKYLVKKLTLSSFIWASGLFYLNTNSSQAVKFLPPYAYVAASPKGKCFLKVTSADSRVWSARMIQLLQNGEEKQLWELPNWHAFPNQIHVSDYCTMVHIQYLHSCVRTDETRCQAGENDIALTIYGVNNHDINQTDYQLESKSYKVIDLLSKISDLDYETNLFSYFWLEEVDFKNDYINMKTSEQKTFSFSMYSEDKISK